MCGVRKNVKASDDVVQKLFFYMVGRVSSRTIKIGDEIPLMIQVAFSFCTILAVAAWSLLESVRTWHTAIGGTTRD